MLLKVIVVKAVLEAAEKALSMENASEQQELTSEEMADAATDLDGP